MYCAWAHTYVCMYCAWAHTYVCMYVLCVGTYVRTYVCTVRGHIPMYVCMYCVWAHTYVCMYVLCVGTYVRMYCAYTCLLGYCVQSCCNVNADSYNKNTSSKESLWHCEDVPDWTWNRWSAENELMHIPQCLGMLASAGTMALLTFCPKHRTCVRTYVHTVCQHMCLSVNV